MTTEKIITGTLHRVQRGHGRGFVATPPPVVARAVRPARVAVMLALAHKIAAAIAVGRLQDQADAARRLELTRARVTQLLALLALAPDVQEQVLFLESVDGIEPLTERALRRAVRSWSWEAQRAIYRSLRPTSSGKARQEAPLAASTQRETRSSGL
jgi:hypothetical protein